MSLPDPTCPICEGSGWSANDDHECPCIRDADPVNLDETPRYLTVCAQERLEVDIHRILIDARKTSSAHDARQLTIAVVRGALPPNVDALVTYANVNHHVAVRIWDLIQAAVQPKRSEQ